MSISGTISMPRRWPSATILRIAVFRVVAARGSRAGAEQRRQRHAVAAPRADLRQFRIGIDLDPPALVVRQVPVETVHLVPGQDVEEPADLGRGVELARHVEMRAAPARFGRILDLAAGGKQKRLRVMPGATQDLAQRDQTVEEAGPGRGLDDDLAQCRRLFRNLPPASPCRASTVPAAPPSAAARTIPSAGKSACARSAKAEAASFPSLSSDLMSRPAGVARLPLIATARGQGTTEISDRRRRRHRKDLRALLQGGIVADRLGGAIATGAMEPSASST